MTEHNDSVTVSRELLTDEEIYAVVRSVQPDLSDTSQAWAQLFLQCKYWVHAAHTHHGLSLPIGTKLVEAPQARTSQDVQQQEKS